MLTLNQNIVINDLVDRFCNYGTSSFTFLELDYLCNHFYRSLLSKEVENEQLQCDLSLYKDRIKGLV